MTGRTRLLRVGGIAAAGLGLILTTPALAAPGSSVTAADSGTHRSVAGQTLTANTTIQVSGRGSQPGRAYTLDLVEPDGTTYRQVTARANVSPARPRIDLATLNQPNGPWTAALTGGGQAGFTLAVPPAQVSGLVARTAGGRVTIRWTANPEPDIVGYALRGPNGSTENYSPGQAGCATGNACAVGYRPTAGEAGATLRFTVAAERNGGCGCAGQPLSGPPAEASVRAPAAADQSSTRRGSGGIGSPGSSFPSAGNESGIRGDAVGTGGFTTRGQLQAFVPGTGALPGSASNGARNGSVLPGGEGPGAASDPGGYRDTLAYPGGQAAGTQAHGEREPGDPLGSALVGSTTLRSLGLAAVLFLAAVHLLLWLRRNPVEV